MMTCLLLYTLQMISADDNFFPFLFILMSVVCVLVTQLCLTLCNPMGCPWDSPGKNTGVDCHSLLQGIFPTQGLNPGLQHCRQMLYHLRSSERANFCFIDYAKAFDCVDHNKLWKILREMGIPDHLTCLFCMQVRKQQLELDMEKQAGSK